MKSFLFITFLSCALCMPQEIRKESSTEKSAVPVTQISPVSNDESDLLANDKKVRPPMKNNANKNDFQNNASFGFIQTVRKEWKCVDGHCTEHITKCKNGRCDSANNSFKADHYEPDLPKIDPFPFGDIKFPDIFAELFKTFLSFDLGSPLKFENTGLMDFVVDDKNSEYYFSNAKFVNSKCTDGICAIKTKTCVNDKCDENVTTRSFF